MSNQNSNERKAMKVLINQVTALINVMENITKNNSEVGFNFSSCKDFARIYQSLADESIKYIRFSAQYHSYDIDSMKNIYDMTGIDQKNLFESVLVSAKMLQATLDGYFDFAEDETDNLENFIFKRFRRLFRPPPSSEKDVQDTLESLFIGNSMDKGIDYDRETGKFNFAGREYIPDFIIPKLNLCLEVKLIKESAKRSKLIEEINADITAYSKKYDRILFVVYDLGCIRDETEFKRDIEASGNIKVLLVKH